MRKVPVVRRLPLLVFLLLLGAMAGPSSVHAFPPCPQFACEEIPSICPNASYDWFAVCEDSHHNLYGHYAVTCDDEIWWNTCYTSEE